MGIRTPRLRSALLLVTIAAGTVVVIGSPAAAALPGTVRVELTSVPSSSDKAVTVPCPAGTRVLNASGSIRFGGASVIMDGVIPDASLTSVTVSAVETDPIPSSWTVTAVATCAPTPAGLERIDSSSVNDSTDKSATAICTGGKQLLGTGAFVKGSAGDIIMDEMVPNGIFGAASTGVTVWAFEDDPTFTGTWRVIAYAICADPLAGQQTLWAVGAWNSDNKGWSVTCDPGQVATGTGVEVGSTTDEGEILITAVYPNGSASAAPTTVKVYAEEEDAVLNDWGITAFVLCVDA